MRPARPLLVALAFPLLLTACGMITGLDGITESACAPMCGEDGGADQAPAAEGSPGEASADAGSERGMVHDGTVEANDSGNTSDDSDASGADGAPTDGAPRGDVASGDGPAEVSSVDAPDDTGPASGDAPADGPCGTVYFRDAFGNAARGWTLDTSWSIASTCASPPAPQKGNADPTVDHTTGAAGGVLGAYVCGNNPASQATAFAYATSPVIDTTGASSLVLGFYRWLNTDEHAYMASTVDVYDGSAWVSLYTNPTGSLVTDASWTKVTFDLSAYAGPSLRVRFGYSAVTSQVYAMSCWNVDDVTVSTVTCP